MKKKMRVQVKDNSLSIETKMEEEIHVQVKDNSPSIERILRPISYISWFLGVGVARPRKCLKAITIIIRFYDLASKVNDIYSLHLLFCSANSFSMAVSSLFQLFDVWNLKTSHYLFLSLQIFLCIVFVTKFYLTCWICTLTCEESDNTGRIIYEITLKYQPVNIDKHKASNISRLEVRPPLENLDGEQCSNWGSSDNLSYIDMDNLLCRNLNSECVLKEINDFSIQLQQHRVTFTACNFFEMNNALFKGFVGLFITYLIIVSQLNQQSDEDFREKFYNFSKEFNDSREEFDEYNLNSNSTLHSEDIPWTSLGRTTS
ncbi:uncharacterized protein LOC105195377 [Solenopsis invicta]|uniref:uncharacterized protein LOC105195377 n=1 Tax=Solenopsis invicta TaxID=13686 RepID=UPI00193CF67E|nr:uncharacterized protein LOC105195377 [Solenopsis invicta]